MNITWWKGLFLFFSVFVLTIIFERLLIPALRRRHAGQHILEIGPAWHKEKEGTPTMGGLGFMAAFLITVLLFGLYCFFSGQKAGFLPLALLSLFAFLCGAVGFVDDPTRDSTMALMEMRGVVDVLIPRGGRGLIRSVVEHAKVPVIETGAGNCHLYVDSEADLSMALQVAVNAKTSRLSKTIYPFR